VVVYFAIGSHLVLERLSRQFERFHRQTAWVPPPPPRNDRNSAA
jgi:hypothetical protein